MNSLSMLMLTFWLVASVAAGPPRARQLKTCPPGFQAVLVKGKQDCVCEEYHVYWAKTGLCYLEYSRGPCGLGQQIVTNMTGHAECKCPGFWAEWSNGTCYQEYTRGPCEAGQLFLRREDDRGFCFCSPDMIMNYYRPDNRCYSLYEQGPCPGGHMFKFDYKKLQPVCHCKEGHILEADGTCYELNTAGPCDQTACGKDINCYLTNLDTLSTECKCLPGNVTTPDGHCYEPYSRGHCEVGEWLVFSQPGVATCQRKEQCSRFDNWFFWPEDETCYRQYSNGPCPLGKLFHLDLNTGVSGCECRKDWTPYYYTTDSNCYEQHSIGPCKEGKYFSFNHTSAATECNCFTSHVLHEETDICHERMTQGPCPEGQLVVEHPVTGGLHCECTESMTAHYWPAVQKCYQHFVQGPCPEGFTFRLDEASGTPNCTTWG